MVEFKLTIGDPKTGKCVQRTVSENAANAFIGLKIGDTVKGETIDLTGYEFQITGGSDFCGFPMRKGITGARKRILAKGGVGFRKYKGTRIRKTVCGETINDKVSQINLKVLKQGKAPLAAEKKEGEAAPEAKAEAPKEAPKPEAPGTQTSKSESDSTQEKKEAPKEEAPKEAPKEEKPKEEPKGEESK